MKSAKRNELTNQVEQFPMNGSFAEVNQWAYAAKEAMDCSAASIADLQKSIRSIDRWSAQGCYDFIAQHSQLKMLLDVGRHENFNTAQIATISDNGTIRGFEVQNGVVTKSKHSKLFDPEWSI